MLRHMGRPTDRFRGVLDVVATVAMLAAASAILWTTFRPSSGLQANRAGKAETEIPVPASAVSLTGAVRKGNATAKVAIVEFSEFQCPYCARFASETLPWLTQTYVDTGQVLLAFRHLPIESLHPIAFGAAEIAACATPFGTFWSIHDAFFLQPKASSLSEYEQRAANRGLGRLQLDDCRTQGRAGQQVRSDLMLAKSLRISGTPTFLVGLRENDSVKVIKIIQGARPASEFDAAIRAALGLRP